ncbi:Glutathione reductase, partial [Haemophilus influenzae]
MITSLLAVAVAGFW